MKQDQEERKQGDVLPWPCVHCHRAVGLVVLDAWEEHHEEHYRTTVAKCEECLTPYVLLQDLSQIGATEWEWNTPVRQYPAQRQFAWSIPSGIRNALLEASANLDDRRWSSAAVQARRAVEMLRGDKSAVGRNLQKRLEWLRDQGHISRDVYEWSDAVRDVGNEGAHEAKVDRRDAEDAVEFAITVCELVYVMPARLERHQKRPLLLVGSILAGESRLATERFLGRWRHPARRKVLPHPLREPFR